MAGRPSELGPTGTNVGARVKHFRDKQSYADLSRQLALIGREIPPLGLRRIESGERRVDADDLVALAVALGVTPVSLLMPAADDADEAVSVTGVVEAVPAGRLWGWLTAAAPLVAGSSADTAAFLLRVTPAGLFGEQFDVVVTGLGAGARRVLHRHGSEEVIDPDGDDK